MTEDNGDVVQEINSRIFHERLGLFVADNFCKQYPKRSDAMFEMLDFANSLIYSTLKMCSDAEVRDEVQKAVAKNVDDMVWGSK